ncbi:hypothetical protein LAZ67_19001982 [Cordylochernes scorpioides]|uniref:Transposase n=1 Tax=Cordylochernes scorpioides TaxID=51811 RepID=A0ABY6LI43_9ARAC|nr:hypothetical protein LAZ67_19001982 [Cordylochernes scorpioides]
MDQRTCIKFCVKNEIKCADAFRMLTVAYGEATLDRSNVYLWYKMFSEGREDVNDEERAGRPSTSTTDEKINEVEKMILANRRITVREVAEDLNISIGSCHSIFINDLGMRRVAAKFVPKLLNCDQKQHRMNIANEMLDSVRDDPNLFQRVITGDEASVVHHEFLSRAKQSARNTRICGKTKIGFCTTITPLLTHHLAPCDIFLFPKLKRPMKGRRYATLDEIKTASKEKLKKILKNDFLKCFEDWKTRWHKCIISHGDYFEGDKIDRRDLGYSKTNSGSDHERTLGPQEAFCPLGSQTFDTRLKGCKEKVIFGKSCVIYTPESKQQSMQWRHSGSPPPKKAKTVPTAGKVMVPVFWDSEGVLLLDFLNKGRTITGNYYAIFVKQLREAINEKRRGKLSRKIVYLQDNAPSHWSLQAMAAIYDSGFELLPHAPYSPDLAPSDFHLFPHLKKTLSGIHFRSAEEVIDAVTSFFESLEISFFLEGIKALEHRWKKCIDVKWDYVEN